MRWRFVDRIEAFESWSRIRGIKTVSFEEFSLLKRFGRKGSFPESLVIEHCVELGRWLVMKSSGFKLSSILSGVDAFSFASFAGAGDRLATRAEVKSRSDEGLILECLVHSGGRTVAGGRLTLFCVPLAQGFERSAVEGIWNELHAAS